MVDLGELCGALKSAMAEGGGHKVFFYAAGKNGAGLRHGFIAIVDPQTCQLNFEQLDNDHALIEIPQLNFIKVQALPMIGQNPATGTNPTLETQHVLNMFDPAMHAAVDRRAAVFSDAAESNPTSGPAANGARA